VLQRLVRSISILLLASAAAPAQKVFEVASIKPNAENDNRIMIRMQPGGRFTATGVTLKQLMNQAFNVRDSQITNGPGWISSDRYDVNAKAEGAGDRIPPEELRPMLRALLEERFQLKTHKETREMSVYALVVGKSGSKLTPSKAERGPQLRMGRGQLSGTRAPVALLAFHLAQQLGRTVIDKTGLQGDYDFTLEFTPEPGHGGGPFGGPTPPDAVPAAGSSGPTIFTAVQEQLGLRLESQKGPVEIIVIDHVAKPTEN
jgi:uncharacterized protein (TIGR03435 family)